MAESHGELEAGIAKLQAMVRSRRACLLTEFPVGTVWEDLATVFLR